jgi:hypothetical protein
MTTFSKQAELDFMHNFRHDTEGDRWAKHEIESLRAENMELKNNITICSVRIKELSQQVTLLRDALLTCSVGDFSTGHVIHPSFDEKLVEEALAATEEVK